MTTGIATSPTRANSSSSSISDTTMFSVQATNVFEHSVHGDGWALLPVNWNRLRRSRSS